MISCAANISLVEFTLHECLNQVTWSDDSHYDNYLLECIINRIDITEVCLEATDVTMLLQ